MLDGRWRAKVERGLEPVGKGLHRAGISADGSRSSGSRSRSSPFVIADGHLVLGVIGLILTGVPDILDGSVARAAVAPGPGAFFDSVCDRIAGRRDLPRCRLVSSPTEDPRLPVLVMAVSRCRCSSPASGHGPSRSASRRCGGLMERAERMVLLGIGLAFNILVPVMWVMLVLTRSPSCSAS
jgi:CDP-diacylglycerol--glycerol-3-phosphate 3-phosphatidyltransferase